MTIVAAVKSRDALVLGTDSMTQVLAQVGPGQPPQFMKAYSNATKLFQLGAYDLMVATYGAGNIGHASMGGIVLDFAETVNSKPSSVQKVTEDLAAFVGKIYDKAFAAVPADQLPVLGFLVGGYSSGQALAELWEVRFPTLTNQKSRTAVIRKPDDFGACWRGIEIPFTRLHFGYDPRIVEPLVKLGLTHDKVVQVLAQMQSPVLFDSMPIQDTVDFAKHILRTTIAVSTFEVGVAACGDPLQLACLRRKGFQWVEEPRFHV